jgi:hypothetical protein
VTTRTIAAFAAFALLQVAAVSPAYAQRANGPYSGLFGGAPSAERTQGLDFNMALFGAYDDNAFPALAASDIIDPRLKQSGASVGTTASLNYDLTGDRAHFTWSGGGTGRKYSSPGAVVAYNTGSSFSLKLRQKLVFTAGGGASYSPFFQFSSFQDPAGGPSGPVTSDFGFAAVAERNVIASGSLGLTSNFTARSSFVVSVDRYEAHLLDSPENDLSSWGGHVGVRHHLTRALGLHLDYGQQQVHYATPDAPTYTNASIDAGVDYGQTFTFARRTSFSFTTSTSAVRYLDQTHYRLNGSAQLSRGFRRSWSAHTGYSRDTEFRIGFRAPLLTDSITAGVGGLLSLRTKWSTAGGYTRGAIGFAGSGFNVYSASTRLDVALNRTLGLYGQYSYYRYEIPPGSSDINLLSKLSRQIATVGLSVWVPIINDTRPPRESK